MKISPAVYMLSLTPFKTCPSEVPFLSCDLDMVYLILPSFFLKEPRECQRFLVISLQILAVKGSIPHKQTSQFSSQDPKCSFFRNMQKHALGPMPSFGYTIKPWNSTNIIVSKLLQRYYQSVCLIGKSYQNKSF